MNLRIARRNFLRKRGVVRIAIKILREKIPVYFIGDSRKERTVQILPGEFYERTVLPLQHIDQRDVLSCRHARYPRLEIRRQYPGRIQFPRAEQIPRGALALYAAVMQHGLALQQVLGD